MSKMGNLYQEAFAGVGAPAPLRERVLALGNDKGTSVRHYARRLSGAMAAAILMLALLGCGTVAAIYGDSIQSWLGHYWEVITGQTMTESQAAVIDHLSQELNLSQTVGDVTVTVDSATVGDDIFYVLLRVEGAKFSQRHHYGFAQENLSISPDPLNQDGGIASYRLDKLAVDGDGSLLLLLEHEYTSNAGFNQDTTPLEITLTLENFVQNPHADRKKILQEGVWEFSFPLDRTQAFAAVPLPDTQLPVLSLESEEMVSALFTHMEVTNTGIRFRFDAQGGNLDLTDWPVAVLTNGLDVESSGGSGTTMEDGATLNCSYHWRVPIDLEDVAAVRFGDTVIPVP